MSEYVSREDARKILCAVCGCVRCDTERCPFWQELGKLPVADVIERKHGKWIGIPHKTVSKRNRVIHSMMYICSACRYSNGRHKSNFCPDCGADMRGKEGE